MASEQLESVGNHQTVTAASRVMIRFVETMPDSDRTIIAIANLQRAWRDTDRRKLGSALIAHGRTDGGIYADVSLPTEDKLAALTFTVESLTNALYKDTGQARTIGEAYVMTDDPELSTPFAWAAAQRDPNSDSGETARQIMAKYTESLFPAIDIDPALESLYQYQ